MSHDQLDNRVGGLRPEPAPRSLLMDACQAGAVTEPCSYLQHGKMPCVSYWGTPSLCSPLTHLLAVGGSCRVVSQQPIHDLQPMGSRVSTTGAAKPLLGIQSCKT